MTEQLDICTKPCYIKGDAGVDCECVNQLEDLINESVGSLSDNRGALPEERSEVDETDGK